ncbi:MAG TPA: hypothetical protein VGJ91_06290 [Polyangiaceae bacterium]|jgi:hypothetical protein
MAKEYEKRQFFRALEEVGSPAEVQALVPALTFFVFAFQDILRLNEQQIVDPSLKVIARQHRAEDAGHQNWFLHDARCLGVEPNLEWTFSSNHRVTRDTSYRLVSEVFRASDDRVRVVVPMVLEAAGHPFFSRVFRFFENAGVDSPLKYFALTHWQIESGHEMLQEAQGSFLQSLTLPDALRSECLAMMERMFAAMATMVDDLRLRMQAARAEQPIRRSPALQPDSAVQ